jgi:hypothetical protein
MSKNSNCPQQPETNGRQTKVVNPSIPFDAALVVREGSWDRLNARSSTRGDWRLLLLLRSLPLATRERLLPLHILPPLGQLQLAVEDLGVGPEVAWRHVEVLEERTAGGVRCGRRRGSTSCR